MIGGSQTCDLTITNKMEYAYLGTQGNFYTVCILAWFSYAQEKLHAVP